jgi:hypothetical protein
MAYTQTPGRGNFDKTGNGLPGTLNSGSTASTSIDPPVKNLNSTSTSTKNGNTTTTNTSYSNQTAINQVKGATGIEFTKEGMNSIAPSSTTKNTELDLGKYKNHLTKGTRTSTGKDATTQTYQAIKNRVMNPAHRVEIESYLKGLNPGKTVKIADWK